MPRKTKEPEEMPVKSAKIATTKKSTPKETVAKKSTRTKKVTTKTTSKTATKSTKTTSTKKLSPKDTVVKNTKNEPSATTSKTKNAKTSKSSTKETKIAKATKKSSTKDIKKANTTNAVSLVEYYDLPLRYNQTIVKILAQTPNMLFIYWDIADSDRKSFTEHYGENFFKDTKPVLIVHNKTMNYSFEIEINDFANSWYLHVNDTDCKYEIELGRRPFTHISTIKEEYIYISSSNEMNSPNNHILFERFNPSVTYKNLKNGNTTKRNFSSLSNYKNMQEIYSIYDLYKTIYKVELFGEITGTDLTNPSSISSSSFR